MPAWPITPPLTSLMTIAPVPAKTSVKVPRSSESSLFMSAAFGAGRAAGRRQRRSFGSRSAFARQANATGEAVGVLPATAESERTIDDFGAFDRELRHDAVLVFDFDRQVVMRQHIACAIEDGGQFARDEAVIDIVMHPGLQQAGLQRAPRAAAVDEALRHMADLGDVKVRRGSTRRLAAQK
jgi:hypothetical protein